MVTAALAIVSAVTVTGCSAASAPLASSPAPTMREARETAHRLVDGFIAEIPPEEILSTRVTADRPGWFQNGADHDAVPSEARWMYYVDVVLDQSGAFSSHGQVQDELFRPYVEAIDEENLTWTAPPTENDFTLRYTSEEGSGTPWVYGIDGLDNGQVEVPVEVYLSVTAFSRPAAWDQGLWEEVVPLPQVWPETDTPEGAQPIERYSPR